MLITESRQSLLILVFDNVDTIAAIHHGYIYTACEDERIHHVHEIFIIACPKLEFRRKDILVLNDDFLTIVS